MIIVDVYVPVYEKTYDMEIDEGLGIAMVIEEMATIICQKESSKWEEMSVNYVSAT